MSEHLSDSTHVGDYAAQYQPTLSTDTRRETKPPFRRDEYAKPQLSMSNDGQATIYQPTLYTDTRRETKPLFRRDEYAKSHGGGEAMLYQPPFRREQLANEPVSTERRELYRPRDKEIFPHLPDSDRGEDGKVLSKVGTDLRLTEDQGVWSGHATHLDSNPEQTEDNGPCEHCGRLFAIKDLVKHEVRYIYNKFSAHQ